MERLKRFKKVIFMAVFIVGMLLTTKVQASIVPMKYHQYNSWPMALPYKASYNATNTNSENIFFCGDKEAPYTFEYFDQLYDNNWGRKEGSYIVGDTVEWCDCTPRKEWPWEKGTVFSLLYDENATPQTLSSADKQRMAYVFASASEWAADIGDGYLGSELNNTVAYGEAQFSYWKVKGEQVDEKWEDFGTWAEAAGYYESFYNEIHNSDGSLKEDLIEDLTDYDEIKICVNEDNSQNGKYYIVGPFEIKYPEGGFENENGSGKDIVLYKEQFSYINNIYMTNESGKTINDIEIINENGEQYENVVLHIEGLNDQKGAWEVKEVKKNTPKSGEEFYVKFSSKYAQTHISLGVEFTILESCKGNMAERKGKQYVYEWSDEYTNDFVHDRDENGEVTGGHGHGESCYQNQQCKVVPSKIENPELVNHPCERDGCNSATCRTTTIAIGHSVCGVIEENFQYYECTECDWDNIPSCNQSNNVLLCGLEEGQCVKHKYTLQRLGPEQGYDVDAQPLFQVWASTKWATIKRSFGDIDISMKIEGYVFLDQDSGKVNTGDNIKQNDEAMAGVEVTLYDQNNNIVTNAIQITVEHKASECYSGRYHFHKKIEQIGDHEIWGCFLLNPGETEEDINDEPELKWTKHPADCYIKVVGPHEHDPECEQPHKHESSCYANNSISGKICGLCDPKHVGEHGEGECSKCGEYHGCKPCTPVGANYKVLVCDKDGKLELNCPYDYKLDENGNWEYSIVGDASSYPNDKCKKGNYSWECDHGSTEIRNLNTLQNPVVTDENGYYQFSPLKAFDENGEPLKYYVKFTYNGILYTNVLYNSDGTDTSKSTENSDYNGNENGTGNRQNFNGVFSEIGSYPNNYKIKNKVFGNDLGDYNKTYSQEEIVNIFKMISERMVGTWANDCSGACQNVFAVLNEVSTIDALRNIEYKGNEQEYIKLLQEAYETKEDKHLELNNKKTALMQKERELKNKKTELEETLNQKIQFENQLRTEREEARRRELEMKIRELDTRKTQIERDITTLQEQYNRVKSEVDYAQQQFDNEYNIDEALNSRRSELELELKRMIQFAADCRIDAYSVSKYPLVNQFVIGDEGKTIGNTTYSAIYCLNHDKNVHDHNRYNIYNQLHVNLGIKARPALDLYLEKGVQNVVITINGKDETYNYNPDTYITPRIGINEEFYLKGMRGAYLNNQTFANDMKTFGIDRSYINQDTGEKVDIESLDLYVRPEDITNGELRKLIDNSDESIASSYNLNDEKLKIQVKYRLKIVNQASVSGTIAEIVDYYDNNFEFKDAYVGNSKEERLGNVKSSITSKYGEATEYKSTGYKTMYLIPENERILNSSETQYIYVVFDVINPDVLLTKELLEEGKEKLSTMNAAEINGYKSSEGAIDLDSVPGNFNISGIDNINNITEYVKKNNADLTKTKIPYEDDAERAPALFFKITEIKTIEGNVFEDVTPTEIRTKQTRNGDGEYGSGDKLVQGVIVELVEIKDGKGYVRARTTTNSDGWYKFKGFIPGNYVIRYTYGKDEKTAMMPKYGGLNSTSYNGQDYQSLNRNLNDEQYWYSLDVEKRLTDAVDSAASINRVHTYSNGEYEVNITNHKAEVFNSYMEEQPEHIDENTRKVLANELMEKTYREAFTKQMNIEVEYTTKKVTGNKEYEYNIKNVDFGIVERPRSELIIDQDLAYVKITLSDGRVLFDADITENMNVENLQHINATPISNKISWSSLVLGGLKRQEYDKLEKTTLFIDEELMNGALLEITYNITVTNNDEAGIGTTRAKNIINYVSNNLTFDVADNGDLWEVVASDKIQSDSNSTLINNKTVDLSTQSVILKASDKNPLTKALNPDESTTPVQLKLKKVLSTDENNHFTNLTEIVEIENQVGRYDHGATPGNQKLDEQPQEHDTSGASQYASNTEDELHPFDGIVEVTPPTGEPHNTQNYIMGISLVAILAVGISLITKFVLDKKKM